MAKILWDDDYLRSFVKELMKPANPIQFWEFDENDEVMEYKIVTSASWFLRSFLR